MLRGYVDVYAGKMTLQEITSKISLLMVYRSPKRVIVDVQRKKGGYFTSIWISKKDFDKCK